MPNGQKIFIHEYGTKKQLCEPVYGFILPRPGDMYSIFDPETNKYTHCEVVSVMHGSNTKDHIMMSSIQVKIVAVESASEWK